MPIYAYRCEKCSFTKDVLQKMSDDVLTICPACNEAHFTKQITAAGFQLKGSGWYVTDFRDNGKASASSNHQQEASSQSAPKNETTTENKTSTTIESTKTTATVTTSSSATVSST